MASPFHPKPRGRVLSCACALPARCPAFGPRGGHMSVRAVPLKPVSRTSMSPAGWRAAVAACCSPGGAARCLQGWLERRMVSTTRQISPCRDARRRGCERERGPALPVLPPAASAASKRDAECSPRPGSRGAPRHVGAGGHLPPPPSAARSAPATPGCRKGEGGRRRERGPPWRRAAAPPHRVTEQTPRLQARFGCCSARVRLVARSAQDEASSASSSPRRPARLAGSAAANGGDGRAYAAYANATAGRTELAAAQASQAGRVRWVGEKCFGSVRASSAASALGDRGRGREGCGRAESSSAPSRASGRTQTA